MVFEVTPDGQATVAGLMTDISVEQLQMMGAADVTELPSLHAHLGWTVMVYNIAETLPNFINPFWMLPLLGVLGLKSKDLIGYTAVRFFVHFPIVMLLIVI